MEALATVAVVSSIVQLVDFSSKLLSNGAKIYDLVDESLTKNATVEQITKDLLPLNEKIPSICREFFLPYRGRRGPLKLSREMQGGFG